MPNSNKSTNLTNIDIPDYVSIFTSPPIGGGRGIVMPMSVCLSVCLCVCVCVCLSVFSQNFKV